jgi:DNA-binding beta-propeller fold protein YncE
MSAKVSLKLTAYLWVGLLWTCMMPVWCAPVGKVVAIGGHASDLAIDEGRKVLYVANFTANRIEVMSLADGRVQTSINVAPNPGSLALSPDGRFLVITHYGNFQAPTSPTNAVTIIDLMSNGRQTFAMGAPPLGVAFGIDGRALVVTTTEFLLLDPATGSTQTLETISGVTSKVLPVTTGNFPTNIVASSMATSGDGLKIFGLLAGGANDNLTIEFRYDVDSRRLSGFQATSTPPLGPRVISVNRDGSLHLAGWALGDLSGSLVAQFPDPAGVLNIGSHVFDNQRNLIYAQMTKAGTPTTGAAAEGPQLQILDPENLAVLERLQLPENLSGRSVLSGDGSAMYAVSESGVTIIPIGLLSAQPRVVASVEDVTFRGNFCDRQVGTRQITILDPGGNRTAFQLNSRLAGVTVSPSSGLTPATVTIRVDPTVFQNLKGTASGLIDIVSTSAVNVTGSIRVLINNKEPDQRGISINVAGRLVDLIADPTRDRFFVLRQDKNQVLVFDGGSYTQIGTLKTGNTPTQLAISFDRRWLMVGHDNSQLISVFDLETLQPSAPIRMPFGHYPRSIASSGRATLARTSHKPSIRSKDRERCKRIGA